MPIPDIESMNIVETKGVKVSDPRTPGVGEDVRDEHGEGQEISDPRTRRVSEDPKIRRKVVEFITKPMDPNKDPMAMIRAIRVEGRKEGPMDVLCIKVNHMAADAAGVKEYAYLLARYYNELAVDPDFIPQRGSHHERSLRQVTGSLPLDERISAFLEGFSDLNKRRKSKGWQLPLPKQGSRKTDFSFATISPDNFLSTKRYAKQNKRTFNDVILSAYILSLRDWINPGPRTKICVQTTVDLRRYLPGDNKKAIANLSGFCYLDLGTDIDGDFDSTLELVGKAMKNKKERMMGLTDWIASIFAFKMLPFKVISKIIKPAILSRVEKGHYPPAITNFGIIDQDRFKLGGVEVKRAYMTAPAMYSPFFTMAVSTFNNEVTLSSGISSNVDMLAVKKVLKGAANIVGTLGKTTIDKNTR